MAISRDMLVQGLRQCLAATPKFAEVRIIGLISIVVTAIHFQLCLPLLFEKLSSDILDAKLDALCTLTMAAPVYGAVALKPFLQQLWIAVKNEVHKCTYVHKSSLLYLQMLKSTIPKVQVRRLQFYITGTQLT